MSVSSALRPVDAWLERPAVGRLSRAALALAAIMAGAALLHTANLAAIGDANPYYTAAVKSMLQSWSNFFFAAAEPGGSVSVDKPPLGLWTEALSAALFGVNGLAVALPNLLAALASLPLVCHLVRRWFGAGAGLTAALALAATPIGAAAARNNTPDWQLTFLLLLAAWAFVKSVDTGRRRFLWIGAVLVGLAFNVKMLQAYLVLPALFALYFLAARSSWRRKAADLAIAAVLLAGVSLAWVAAVDLTPAALRPRVGGSTANQALDLALGYNGLSRLVGPGNPSVAAPDGRPSPPAAEPDEARLAAAAASLEVSESGLRAALGDPSSGPPDLEAAAGKLGVNADALRSALAMPTGGVAAPGASGPAEEIGAPGMLRLFRLPLAAQLGWLLPAGLAGLALAAASRRIRLPLTDPMHRGAVLWGGWLLTGLAFFSLASFFHAYYLVMLAPALSACVGMGAAALLDLADRHRRLAAAAGGAIVAGSAIYQALLAGWLRVPAGWWPAVAVLLTAGVGLAWRARGAAARLAGGSLLVAALLLTPAVWTVLTVLDPAPHPALPSAYLGPANRVEGARPAGGAEMTELASYLQANTQDVAYLAAVPSSQQGADLVLATGRPVLYMGGFNGSDPVADAADLQRRVAAGELRFVLGSTSAEMRAWLRSACDVVTGVDLRAVSRIPQAPGGQGDALALYRCGQ
jgi:4-amino-4-deoxy-L-arabinose transferase-like glycosyltransferase